MTDNQPARQTPDPRLEALILALMDEFDLEVAEERAERVLRRIDVRDPLRAYQRNA